MSTDQQPQSLAEFIDAIRAELVCDRCRRYIGSLAATQYLPPPYPVALDKIGADDEVAALIGFEWHMVGMLREGKFTIRHPQRDGGCVSIREWARGDDDDDEAADDEVDEGDNDA
ncbi:MAG TPA: hypothetical protein VIH21_06065 [Dehalococcoidia bacterium]